MFGKTIAANIVSLLAFLRIIPSGRSKASDTIGLIGWMVLIVGCTAVYVYIYYPIYSSRFDNSIPCVFALLATFVIPVFQTVITLPIMAYHYLKNPGLVYENEMPNPRKVFRFVGSMAMHFINIATSTFYMITESKIFNLADLELDLPYFVLWTISTIFSSFVIGTSIEKFCKKVNDTEIKCFPYSFEIIEERSQELKTLKCGLSPMLFLIFGSKCILLINFSLSIAQNPHTYLGFIQLITNLLDLTYVTLVADEAVSVYKSLSSKLRLVYVCTVQ